MIERRRTNIAILLVISMLLSGCSGQVDETEEQLSGCMDETATNYNPNATNSDSLSCTYEETNGIDPISIPHTEGCDNTNPIHCMLPFPSDAFLLDDETTNTGKRIFYSANTIPGSGTVSPIEIPILNQMDGASPNTQIMTAFSVEPDVSELAGQYSIGKSIDSGHSTAIINQFTGELITHWVELDVRSEEDQPTIIHMRTIEALEHNTSYVVLLSGLKDHQGNTINAPEGFAALRDNVITNSPDIEERRADFQELFTWIIENTDYNVSELQTAWSFHTSSTESIIGPLLSMRNDALERTGQGIGCTIESNTEVLYNDGNTSHRLMTGTFT